jgi:hypothetical protein
MYKHNQHITVGVAGFVWFGWPVGASMYPADDLLLPATTIPYIHLTAMLQLSHYELTRVPCRKCPSVRPFFRGVYVRNCWAGCCEI